MSYAYACIAATEGDARCRNPFESTGPSDMCLFHAKLREAGREVKLAPPPDIILIKFNLNPRWSEQFEFAGVPRKPLLSMEKEEKHVRQAEDLGRQPYRFRQIADSGTPVFGPRGIQDVFLYELLNELLREYHIADMHLRPRRDEKMDVLIITLSKEGEENVPSAEAAGELFSFLAASCWGWCHIWANPRDDKGKVVHTVNSSHRQPDKPARLNVRFNNGLWVMEPAQ